MKQNNRSCGTTVLWGILAFLIGTIIGLVVLGWGLWPVTWTGADPAALAPGAQQDYLRAAIDSYKLNQDIALADFRFNQLGEHGSAVLAAIYASPAPQSEQDIEAFATAVKATEALLGAPPPAQVPVSSVPAQLPFAGLNIIKSLGLQICLVGLVILLVILLIILIISRSRKRRKTAPVPPPVVVQTPEKEVEPSPVTTPLSEDAEPTSKTQPTNVASDSGQPSEIATSELPDWLLDATTSEPVISRPVQTEEIARELSEEEIEEISAAKLPFEDETGTSPDALPALSEHPAQTEQLRFPSRAKTEDAQQPSPFVEPAGEPPVEPETPQPEESFETPTLDQTTEGASLSLGEETPEETYQKFSSDLSSIPGLDEDDVERLQEAGITAPLLLLKNGSTAQDRAKLSEHSGVEETKLLEGVHFVDILRIKGLSARDALTLKKLGIDTLAGLASGDAASLVEKLQQQPELSISETKLPSLEQIVNWISQANQLPRIVS